MKVCVVGGGASGMMCAVMIARKGHDVHLFEKNEKLGKKIYITGKGRCNVTNMTTGNEFLKNVVGGNKFVMGAVTRFNSEDTVKFFESLGVPLKVERGNRVFPVSDKSSDIIKAFEKALSQAGAKVHLSTAVQSVITKEGKAIGVKVNGKEEKFDAVIIATGGISYSSTGSTGDGYKFAKSMGHTVVSTVPALCGIVSDDADCKELQGLTLKNVTLTSKLDDKIIYKSEIGELLFTHFGISGPIVLSTSSYINRQDFSKLKVYIDFKPALSFDQLTNRIDRDIISLKSKQVSSLLEQLLPKSLVQIFAKKLGLNLKTKANQLDREKRKNLINLLKNYEIKPKSLENIEFSVVTAGGVNLKEVNPKFMSSKLVHGIYFIGEVLDIDALTGGFNLQLAFSTAVTCASAF